MWKRLILGFCLVLMLGFFNFGCEPPPDNGGSGGGYEQQQEQAPEHNPYQDESGDQSGGQFD